MVGEGGRKSLIETGKSRCPHYQRVDSLLKARFTPNERLNSMVRRDLRSFGELSSITNATQPTEKSEPIVFTRRLGAVGAK